MTEDTNTFRIFQYKDSQGNFKYGSKDLRFKNTQYYLAYNSDTADGKEAVVCKADLYQMTTDGGYANLTDDEITTHCANTTGSLFYVGNIDNDTQLLLYLEKITANGSDTSPYTPCYFLRKIDYIL